MAGVELSQTYDVTLLSKPQGANLGSAPRVPQDTVLTWHVIKF